MAGTYRYQHGDKPVEGYTILRGIGRGGFGEVYYSISDGGREVALKAIQQNHDIELRGVRHCINLKSPHLVSIFDSALFAFLGTLILMAFFWVVNRVLPFSMKKEIEEDQNVALGIILGAFIIGISIIISAAIR